MGVFASIKSKIFFSHSIMRPETAQQILMNEPSGEFWSGREILTHNKKFLKGKEIYSKQKKKKNAAPSCFPKKCTRQKVFKQKFQKILKFKTKVRFYMPRR